MTASTSGDVFDVKKIRRLVQLMKDHDLAGDRSRAGRTTDSPATWG